MTTTREVGHAVHVQGSALADDNWNLRFPQSVAAFAKMGRQDSQVKSVLNAVMLPIRRASWHVRPNGADEEVIRRVADDLRLMVLGEDPDRVAVRRAGRVSWAAHLPQALRALQYGFAFFEQIYEVGPDGQEHLVKLAPRPQGSIMKINVARDGGLESIEQRPAESGETRPAKIPVNRLVAYVWDQVPGDWTGVSILRSAYKNWRVKDDLIRMEPHILQRNGMGVPVYTGSEYAANPEEDLRQGQKLVEDFRGGPTAGAAVPAGAKLDIKGTSGQLVSPREAITYHDAMIARTALAHFLNLDGKGGSYALATTQSDLFIQSLQTVADWVADIATQHIVEDLVSVAFPNYTGPTPQIACDPIASKQDITPTDLAALVRDGVFHMDPTAEEHVRRKYNFPAKAPFPPPAQEAP